MIRSLPVRTAASSVALSLALLTAPLEAQNACIAASTLDGTDGFSMRGPDESVTFVGSGVAGLGDFNADGFGDLAVGASGLDVAGEDGAGAVYILFGREDQPAEVSLEELDGTDGVRLTALAGPNDLGEEVVGPGDLNGDGIDDLVVAATDFNDAIYVLFGRRGPFPAEIDLGAVDGTNGFQIFCATGSGCGEDLARGGDLNGDGLPELLVRGSDDLLYVLFGSKIYPPALSLDGLNGTNGFVAVGSGGLTSDASAAGGGDVNGDGFEDLVVGSPSGDGAAHIVFGRSRFPAQIDLGALDAGDGFSIVNGDGLDNGLGLAVALGDLNGDGLSDIALSSDQSTWGEDLYVVFGREQFPMEVSVDDLSEPEGISIDALGFASITSMSVADLNADGFDDFLIGDTRPADGAGSVYVLYGAPRFPSEIDLAMLDGQNGFSIKGVGDDDLFGGAVDRAPDLNGDGYADLVVGAQSRDRDGLIAPGEAFAIYGSQTVFLEIEGTCPGTISVSAEGLTPGADVAVLRATVTGESTLPLGPCAGTATDLQDPELIAILTADGNGRFQRVVDVPFSACFDLVQAVDLSTCKTSTLDLIPFP